MCRTRVTVGISSATAYDREERHRAVSQGLANRAWWHAVYWIAQRKHRISLDRMARALAHLPSTVEPLRTSTACTSCGAERDITLSLARKRPHGWRIESTIRDLRGTTACHWCHWCGWGQRVAACGVLVLSTRALAANFGGVGPEVTEEGSTQLIRFGSI
ncbi:hypothetical protein B0H19DRAFT_1370251 [Mycena capillaripes]|nr:hypothetical protein B0H19DRAFT_1370251 [Mycena capillaripes]